MKKNIIMIVVAALLLVGCSDSDGDAANSNAVSTNETAKGEEGAVTKGNLVKDGDTYKITEENYINGVNEVYGYTDEYIGKRIEFEGEYMAEMYENEMYYQVYRTLHDHCDEEHDHSNDPVRRVGFRISYDGDKPTDKSFVRVSGIVDTYEADGNEYLIIDADVLEVCEKAGIVELEQ